LEQHSPGNEQAAPEGLHAWTIIWARRKLFLFGNLLVACGFKIVTGLGPGRAAKASTSDAETAPDRNERGATVPSANSEPVFEPKTEKK
jgi:hypothetical protein